MTDNEKRIEEARDREGALESTATAIRLSLRFDLGWSSDEARTLGAVLAEPVATRLARFRRSEVPEPSTEGYAEFEDWEQEMFRHQPVLSMADGSIAGCQCLDRVFLKGREDWGTHLASVITARLPKPQGEPSDAQVDPWIPHARRALHIHDTWGTPDDPDGKVRPMSDYTELSARMANALRAALAVTEQGEPAALCERYDVHEAHSWDGRRCPGVPEWKPVMPAATEQGENR